jgi:hypothetical protein
MLGCTAFSFNSTSQICQLGSKLGISFAPENTASSDSKIIFTNGEGNLLLLYKILGFFSSILVFAFNHYKAFICITN